MGGPGGQDAISERHDRIPDVYLATTDSPNASEVSFIEQALEKLQTFMDGVLIVGGDFNSSLDPLIDTS